MNTTASAFQQLEAVVTKILAAQDCLGNTACRFLLWRTAERQIQDAMESGCSTHALTDLEQYIAEFVCRLAEDAVWLEIGTPGRVVLVWPDGSAYLHETPPQVLMSILEAGAGKEGRWLDLGSVFSSDDRASLTKSVERIIAGTCQ